MAVNVTVDTAKKIIKVNSGVTELDVKVDLYSDLKEDWLASSSLSNFKFPFLLSGGESIGAGQKAPTFYFLRYPWVVESNGDGGSLTIALNLYGFNETQTDTRNPIIVLAGDSVTNNVSNIPGLDTEGTDALRYASYGGGVSVDVTSTNSGTAYPSGNQEYPVNNIPDAVSIAATKGFKKLFIIGNLTLGAGDDVRYLKLVGTSHINSVLTVGADALCLQTLFDKFDITGTLDGDSEITECIVRNLTYFNGHIHNSQLAGTIYLAGNKSANFDNCKMYDITIPINIDCGATGQNLILTNFTGRASIVNITGASQIGIGLDAGDIIVDSSCTAGIVSISGTGTVTDNSPKTCYVIDTTVDGTELSNLQRLIEYLRPHHTGTGDIYFWNPYDGNDTWDGKHPDRAFKSFSVAHNACKNANHDTIMIVPGDPTGITTITDEMHITKDYLFIRGPGRDVIFNYTAITEPITTTARGTEFSGFRIQNSTINSIGIHTTGAFTLFENLWFENCKNGILIEGSHPVINNVKIDKPIGYGVTIQGNVSNSDISNLVVGTGTMDGIIINLNAGYGNIQFNHITIVNNAEYGLNISATSEKIFLDNGCIIMNNTLGDINNLGSNNVDNSSSLNKANLLETKSYAKDSFEISVAK